MPWWLRIGAKLLLARIPVGYALWQRLKLFRHGAMDDVGYALGSFRGHFANRSPGLDGNGFTALELGPGDSLVSSLIVAGHGGRQSWLVDVGPFAQTDPGLYRDMARRLADAGLAVPDIAAANSVDEILAACNSRYLTDGLNGLRQIPDGAVDFVWSQAVLEHVRCHEFADMMTELRRIMAPGGVASHRIDLRDHLGGALNNLRFSDRVWEGAFFANSGFYTNRLSYSQMVQTFRQAGYAVDVRRVDRWQTLPTPRAKMAPQFRDRPDDDLLVSGFNVVLTHGA